MGSATSSSNIWFLPALTSKLFLLFAYPLYFFSVIEFKLGRDSFLELASTFNGVMLLRGCSSAGVSLTSVFKVKYRVTCLIGYLEWKCFSFSCMILSLFCYIVSGVFLGRVLYRSEGGNLCFGFVIVCEWVTTGIQFWLSDLVKLKCYMNWDSTYVRV